MRHATETNSTPSSPVVVVGPSVAVPETSDNFFPGLLRGDDPIMRGKAAAASDANDPYGLNKLLRGDDPIMRGHEGVQLKSVTVQSVQQASENGTRAEAHLELWFMGMGLLLLAIVAVVTKKRAMLGLFAKPILFFGLFFGLLLALSFLISQGLGYGPDMTGGAVVGLIYGAIAALVGFLARKIWRLDMTKKLLKHEVSTQPASARMPEKTEDSIYATIDIELDSGNMNRGLWTRLYADCDGNDAKTRAAYIRARAVQLQGSV